MIKGGGLNARQGSVGKPRQVKRDAGDDNRRFFANVPVRNLFSTLAEETCALRNKHSSALPVEMKSRQNEFRGHSRKHEIASPQASNFGGIGAGIRRLSTTVISSLEYLEGAECESSTRPFVATHALEFQECGRRRRKRDMAWPYVEKGIMSGMIYMLGEAISCGLFLRNGQGGFYPGAFIRYSVLHSTMIGMFANGPMLHLFFELVDRFVKFESKVLNVVAKVIVDQIVWGCLWNFCYILLMNLATDSPGFGYVGEGLGMDFVVDLYKGFNSAFWKAIHWRLHVQLLKEGLKMLPMDIICYWLVPLPLRALWVASVDVFWVTILSQYD